MSKTWQERLGLRKVKKNNTASKDINPEALQERLDALVKIMVDGNKVVRDHVDILPKDGNGQVEFCDKFGNNFSTTLVYQHMFKNAVEQGNDANIVATAESLTQGYFKLSHQQENTIKFGSEETVHEAMTRALKVLADSDIVKNNEPLAQTISGLQEAFEDMDKLMHDFKDFATARQPSGPYR